ncbi:MAG TPA: hypothetical protein VFV13_13420 [Acidimicrobiia bacterium]|nr:hypothetical protein [Acidimicrobiia bacterium]
MRNRAISDRVSAGLATALAVMAVAIYVVSLMTQLVTGTWAGGGEDLSYVFAALLVLFGAVGVAIARNAPHNAIGWIFLGLSLWISLFSAAEVVLISLGRPDLAEWLGHSAWIPPLLFPATWVLLLFPDGHPPSPRWRFLVWATVLGTLGFVIQNMFGEYLGGVEEYGLNPYHVEGIEQFGWMTALLMAIALVGSVSSVVVRFRRSDGIERQQVKWLAYSGIVLLIVWFLGAALAEMGAAPTSVTDLILLSAIAFVPVSIGLAIRRYRLYEIDRLINRTLSYALVVPVLGVVYVVGAIWLPTRIASDSSIFVAGSTLLVAALFNPLRRKVMRWVDARFNRLRYDGELVSRDFSMLLRDQVDPARIAERWESTVATTLQPASIAIWIREDVP